jgi:cell fate (sporulation/competence/biofilm development) regulator YlbF (YheA/YmcA/DUF963 family)
VYDRQIYPHQQKLFMETIIQEDQIAQKTKELCQAILDQPSMRSARQRIQTFVADEKSRAQYEGVVAKGQALQQKQQRSQPLTGEEISQFEKEREALMSNPVARGFLDAQEEMHQVHQSVNQLVTKTLELGRLPTAEDLGSGGESGGECGQGCGCHH